MSLLHASKKQGLPAPTTKEEREAYRIEKASRRLKNVVNAREILDRNELPYREVEVGYGGDIMFTIEHDTSAIWYYPADGRWYAKGEPVHYGARNLVRFVKGAVI